MIDDFTAGYRGDRAPVDAVKDKIAYLVDLGVNAVEFMPWTAWRGGAFNWGYEPFLFFAVENRYIEDPANPLDRLYRLKCLIDDLHRQGIHVIMDGVFNQVSNGTSPGTGFPYYWLYQDPGDSPYTGASAAPASTMRSTITTAARSSSSPMFASSGSTSTRSTASALTTPWATTSRAT